MTAIISAVTAMQVSTIVAQRNAIKNGSTSSVSSGGNFSLSPDSGFYSGGYTGRDASDRKAVGQVHANEWVAPARMVRANPILFAHLDRERIRTMSATPVLPGYFSGGFTKREESGTQAQDNTPILIAAVNALVQELNKPRKSYVVNSEVNAANEIEEHIRKIGSR